MKSYTTLRNLYGVDTKNSGSTNLSYGDQVMNDWHRRTLAVADWPFLHRTRTLLTVAPSSTFTANAGTDIITCASTILAITGVEVELSTTDTLPAGLSTSTRYYLIYQTDSTFKLASSLANALAGTAIDITDTGTGTHTLSVNTIFQPLPYDMDLVESVTVKVSGTIHTPKPSPSADHFDKLRYSTYNSDIPEWWFIDEGKIAVWPRSATAGNVISVKGKIRVPDLRIADYSTGTVDIITNGSQKVTGSGTSWTKSMVGRWIRVTHTDTDASSGDGEWYEVIAVESSTILYLGRPYGGRSLTTGAAAAYIIGQMPLLPEAFHDLPEFYAAFRYWTKEKDERKDEFKGLYIEGVKELFKAYSVNDLSMVIDDGEGGTNINPNLTISV